MMALCAPRGKGAAEVVAATQQLPNDVGGVIEWFWRDNGY